MVDESSAGKELRGDYSVGPAGVRVSNAADNTTAGPERILRTGDDGSSLGDVLVYGKEGATEVSSSSEV
jgi:hypothetical protein